MSASNFTIITQNSPNVSWLENALKRKGFSISVGDFNVFDPKSVNLLFYYSDIISREFLDSHSNINLLNLHNSLLPKYRGFHAFSWAIEMGEEELGYTLHRVAAEIDAGLIL